MKKDGTQVRDGVTGTVNDSVKDLKKTVDQINEAVKKDSAAGK